MKKAKKKVPAPKGRRSAQPTKNRKPNGYPIRALLIADACAMKSEDLGRVHWWRKSGAGYLKRPSKRDEGFEWYADRKELVFNPSRRQMAEERKKVAP